MVEIESYLMNNYKDIIKKALLIRQVEEKLLELYKLGKVNGTLHTCVGQELIGVSISEYLTNSDTIFSNHRGHGHYIAKTNDIKGLIAEVMGKSDGICGGIGGSQHLYNKHFNFYSSGIQGGMIPVAAGVSLSNKLNENNDIVVVFIGDGTLGEGIFYESLNICSIWKLPILFMLENNKYAQSTSISQTLSGSIPKRVEGFGIKYFESNTWDLEDLLLKASESINYVRNNKLPAFFEVETYRLNPHSKGDDNRDPEEVKFYKKKDILNALTKEFPKEMEKLSNEINIVINESLSYAEKSQNLTDINPTPTLCNNSVTYSTLECNEDEGKRINYLIYEYFKNKFSDDECLVMIGEDIEGSNKFAPKQYGGAFKVTKDLSNQFGVRVRNTPISESALIGVGTGLALSGMHPIVEIMFGDFMSLTFDQIMQHATKFKLMYNNNVNVPLVIRTPMGGKRGYGPTHSQSIEKYFLGVPDLTVIAINHRITPSIIYDNILGKIENPTLIIENKILYTRTVNSEKLIGFNIKKSDELFPTIKIEPNNGRPEVTIICYGGMLEDVELAIQMAFDEEEILCEVITPIIINPININPIFVSVSNTNRLLVVEEGPGVASWGSEVISLLSEVGSHAFSVMRLSNNSIIPSAYEAESNVIPNPHKIFQTIKKLYYD